jgi:hypothetical protein
MQLASQKENLSFPFRTVSSPSVLLSTTSISLALRSSSSRLVVHRAFGVGAQVLESVLGGLLGLVSTGDALVVGVVGGGAGLGAGLALGLRGLAALVGGGHGCWVGVWAGEEG